MIASLPVNCNFGFKARHSTHMCTMILKEFLAYYNINNSIAFCTFLDASKAFDRVRYCKLFRLLIDRGLPPCIIRMLICLYTNHKVRVAWNGVHSQYFLATTGVKQGGVLSRYFICYISMDCWSNWQNLAWVASLVLFVGGLAYADDLALLAPTATAMSKLLSICDDYGKEFSIKFNAKKSKWLAINTQKASLVTLWVTRLSVNFMLVVAILIECHRMFTFDMS